MSGNFFADFIKKKFNIRFAEATFKHDRKRLLVMENDPCESSKAAIILMTDTP